MGWGGVGMGNCRASRGGKNSPAEAEDERSNMLRTKAALQSQNPDLFGQNRVQTGDGNVIPPLSCLASSQYKWHEYISTILPTWIFLGKMLCWFQSLLRFCTFVRQKGISKNLNSESV